MNEATFWHSDYVAVTMTYTGSPIPSRYIYIGPAEIFVLQLSNDLTWSREYGVGGVAEVGEITVL